MSEEIHKLAITHGGTRLDKKLAGRLPHLSRARIQRLIKSGEVTVNGEIVFKPSWLLENNDLIVIHVLPLEPETVNPERIPLEITYEDADVLVVNKPAGMVVHPGTTHTSGTLVNALLAYAPELEGVGNKVRPGIVHRLDKDTSGLIIAARSERARLFIKRQFQNRTVRKAYLALADGLVRPPEGIIDAPIDRSPHRRRRQAVVPGGREAQTEYHTLEALDEHTLLEVKPRTGRTHQIRVHLAFLGYPLAGDRIYGRRKLSVPLKRHFLHAYRLTFVLPGSRQEMTFTAPLPNDLKHVLRLLKSEWSPE